MVKEQQTRRTWALPYTALEPPQPGARRAPEPEPAQMPRPSRNDFRCGEKVSFEDKYLNTVVGSIVRINQRTATVDPGDGTTWRVACRCCCDTSWTSDCFGRQGGPRGALTVPLDPRHRLLTSKYNPAPAEAAGTHLAAHVALAPAVRHPCTAPRWSASAPASRFRTPTTHGMLDHGGSSGWLTAGQLRQSELAPSDGNVEYLESTSAKKNTMATTKTMPMVSCGRCCISALIWRKSMDQAS
ncbi:hypothetical protein RLIN73S_02238 [Rhodanobacter lindaniclasticus]